MAFSYRRLAGGCVPGRPRTGKPRTGKPRTGKPCTGKPCTGKPCTGVRTGANASDSAERQELVVALERRLPRAVTLMLEHLEPVASDMRLWHRERAPVQEQTLSSFSDPQAVARYAERPVRQVPGFLALQTMARLLLAERVPADGQVLVIGAGGGLELKVFAEAHPQWRFVGVDPSAEMLKLASVNVGAHASRVELHEGYTDTAPLGPFDGATCLLTLHFLSREERRHTLAEIHKRLRPWAPLVVAHHSFPQSEPDRTRWLERYAAFAAASGVPAENTKNAAAAIGSRLPLLAPEEEVALLQEAGFGGVELFYAAFSFKGWVAYR